MNLLSREIEKAFTNRFYELLENTIKKIVELHFSETRYLKPDEAKKYCSVSSQTLTKWVNQDGLKQFKKNQTVLYDKKELDKFIENNSI